MKGPGNLKPRIQQTKLTVKRPKHWAYALLDNFWRFYVPGRQYWKIDMQHLHELDIPKNAIEFLAIHKKS